MAVQERYEIPCRECGKPLIFIRTRAGKNMPCEAEPVLYWPDDAGPLMFYQRDGSYERGTVAGHPAVPQESGYVPHWGRCPGRRRTRPRWENGNGLHLSSAYMNRCSGSELRPRRGGNGRGAGRRAGGAARSRRTPDKIVLRSG